MTFQSRIARICAQHPDAPQDLILLSRSLLLTGHQIQQIIARVLESCELSYAQYLAMAMLYADEKGELNPSELVRSLNMTPTQITRLIDSLVTIGWVSRQLDTSDRRRSRLALTSTGLDKLLTAMPLVHQAYHAIWQPYSSSDTDRFGDMLEQLHRQTHAMLEK